MCCRVEISGDTSVNVLVWQPCLRQSTVKRVFTPLKRTMSVRLYVDFYFGYIFAFLIVASLEIIDHRIIVHNFRKAV
jgi:hypothetical protein